MKITEGGVLCADVYCAAMLEIFNKRSSLFFLKDIKYKKCLKTKVLGIKTIADMNFHLLSHCW